MQKEIKQFASVISGYTFRGALTPDTNGQILVLQAKNIIANEPVDDKTSLTQIGLKQPKSESYLKNGDIMIVSRSLGAGGFRATICKTDRANILASSSVHIIRPTLYEVLPEYISAYLNSADGQSKISQIVSGSHLQTLLRKNLEDLEIPVPPIEKQKIIVELQKNIFLQEKIITEKNKIQKNILNAAFAQLTEK